MRQIIAFFQQSAKENREEILDLTWKAQRYVSCAIFILYSVYGIHILIAEGMKPDICFAFLIGGIGGINWLLMRLRIIRREQTILAGNCFLVLLLLCIGVARSLSYGNISELLLVYTIVATVVLSLNPIQYSLCILFCTIFDRMFQGIIYQFSFRDFGAVFLEEGFLLVILIALNLYISYLQHCVFREMNLLKWDSNTDAMTGLYNRRYLEQYYHLHEREAELSALIHIDLDNFKTLNDTFGHQAGDEMLVRMARLIREDFRKSDCVARVGGDEFVIFMPHLMEEENARDRVQSLLDMLPLTAEKGAEAVAISASIGVAFSRVGQPAAFQALYDLADTAMYQAKKTGKGKAVYLYHKEA